MLHTGSRGARRRFHTKKTPSARTEAPAIATRIGMTTSGADVVAVAAAEGNGDGEANDVGTEGATTTTGRLASNPTFSCRASGEA